MCWARFTSFPRGRAEFTSAPFFLLQVDKTSEQRRNNTIVDPIVMLSLNNGLAWGGRAAWTINAGIIYVRVVFAVRARLSTWEMCRAAGNVCIINPMHSPYTGYSRRGGWKSEILFFPDTRPRLHPRNSTELSPRCLHTNIIVVVSSPHGSKRCTWRRSLFFTVTSSTK